MSQLLAEIHQQPDALARLLARQDEVAALAARIRACDPAFVMIAARGTSDNAARYGQYLLGAHNRLAVALAVPSLFTLYGAPPRLDRALTIGISQSGEAPDILAVVAEARRQGSCTLAISNAPASPLAGAAELHLDLGAGAEHAVAATKTYTAELTALAMLSTALSGSPDKAAELATVPALARAALAAAAAATAAARELSGARRLVVLGRGFDYATTFELALKIKETSYVLAEPYSIADFLHGPVALIEPGFPVLLIAPTGVATADLAPLLDLLARRHARVVAFTDRADVAAAALASVPLPAGVPEWLSPLVTIVAGQLFAHALAVARGLDPDRPRGLSKVTRTR